MQIQMSSILLRTLNFNCSHSPLLNKETHGSIIPECCQNEIVVPCKKSSILISTPKQNFSFRLSKLSSLNHLILPSTITFNSLLKQTARETFSVVLHLLHKTFYPNLSKVPSSHRKGLRIPIFIHSSLKIAEEIFIEVETGKTEGLSSTSTTLLKAFRLYLQSNVMQISTFITHFPYTQQSPSWESRTRKHTSPLQNVKAVLNGM